MESVKDFVDKLVQKRKPTMNLETVYSQNFEEGLWDFGDGWGLQRLKRGSILTTLPVLGKYCDEG